MAICPHSFLLQYLVGGLTLALASSASIRAADPAPEVDFAWSGGLSPIGNVKLHVASSGEVEVSLLRLREPIRYSTKLTAEEISALSLAIRATDFFDAKSESPLPPPPDVGITDVTVDYRGKKRTLRSTEGVSLQLIEAYFWKLVQQASLSNAVESGPAFYELLGALDSRHAGAKVLQPMVFKAKIVASLPKQTEFSGLSWRLQALSCLTTPAEFAGILAQAMPEPKSNLWRLWLTTLSSPECQGNLKSNDYLEALIPLFIDQIRMSASAPLAQDSPEHEAFRRFRVLLKERHVWVNSVQ